MIKIPKFFLPKNEVYIMRNGLTDKQTPYVKWDCKYYYPDGKDKLMSPENLGCINFSNIKYTCSKTDGEIIRCPYCYHQEYNMVYLHTTPNAKYFWDNMFLHVFKEHPQNLIIYNNFYELIKIENPNITS